MSKKLTKKQLKTAKGGLGPHIFVPTIDAPIAPDPHVVVVTSTTKTKASKPVKGKISGIIL